MKLDRCQSGSVARHAQTLVALILAVAVFGLGSIIATGHEGHGATPSPAAPECVVASPSARTSTPTSLESSPAAPASVAHLGTPVSQSCLTVTLTADKTTAGPRTLNIVVVDASGAPVTDAEVTLMTRHLGMDHGTSSAAALAIAPGRYAVEQVAMGMAGEWEAEVVISRPGQAPVAFTFVVDLEGPA